MLFFLILVIAILIFCIWFLNKFKIPKTNCLTLVTGGVKSGKTLFSLSLALKCLKRNRRKYKLKKFFFPKKFKNLEMPLLYSNIPLNTSYVEITKDLLFRKSRFNYGSVIFIDEASLVADSQLIKDIQVNNSLLLFNKLIGHELKGGNLIYNTQSVADLHYSIKRSISNYFYVHHVYRLPFFSIVKLVELTYSEDNSVINTNTGDFEDLTKKVLISNKVLKMYDRYSLSTFTDNLPLENKIINNKNKSLKSNKIFSFREDFNKTFGGLNDKN